MKVVFGAGKWARKYISGLKVSERPEMIVDNNEEKWGTEIEGIKIFSPASLLNYTPEELYIVIACHAADEIVTQLEKMGLRESERWEEEPVVSFKGNYRTYKEAEEKCGGYDTEEIFEKVKAATLLVVEGKACYERDSVVFYTQDYNYNLVMWLEYIRIVCGSLKVCDWGGALGSTFLQHRKLLEKIGCEWTIIEQDHFVKYGQDNIQIPYLNFKYTREFQRTGENSYTCVLLSGVLHYLENAEEVICEVCERKVPYIIIERTPVGRNKKVWIQTVHEPIYEATYPCYVFAENEFISAFVEKGYRLLDSWHSLVDGSIDDQGQIVEMKSYVFEFCTDGKGM